MAMESKTITIFAPTPRGYALAQVLQAGLPQADIWTRKPDLPPVSLATAVADHWHRRQQLIFILAVGAVVRLIAPHLCHKTQDPGVVAVDETGHVVLSLSGGHQGGADALARQVAALLGVDPLITSAAESQNLPALDLLGLPYGWQAGSGNWQAVAAALTRLAPIQVIQTCGWDLWRSLFPTDYPFVSTEEQPVAQVWISDQLPPETNIPRVCWHPRTLWVGLGCERGTPVTVLEQAVVQVCAQQGLALGAIAGLASIELKRDEVGIQTLAQQHHWPLVFFRAEDLAQIPVPHPSAVVAEAVGTHSVAEAAAIQAAQGSLVVTKQIIPHPQGACTVAIARSTQGYNPNPGELHLIGIGPGALDQMTGAARAALAQCHLVIGYQRYLDLIQPLHHPQQILEASPITQERQRAERAIALAQRGLKVGVVSSGDCGIYGMAGLVLECLAAQDWDGCTPRVSLLPGITALQAVAARLGAPLMNDFCAISLSDLLTPWPVIEHRLGAAAQADFVVALYNPRSQTRTAGLQRAIDIFRQGRSPETPVAIARSAYRLDEQITRTTLADVNIETVDMLTLVLIGNASTFIHQGHLITPRGYLPNS